MAELAKTSWQYKLLDALAKIAMDDAARIMKLGRKLSRKERRALKNG